MRHGIISDEDMTNDCHSGEHLDGRVRQREEEMRKNEFFSQFHSNMEHLNENHGDKNKEGRRDKMTGYDKQDYERVRDSYE